MNQTKAGEALKASLIAIPGMFMANQTITLRIPAGRAKTPNNLFSRSLMKCTPIRIEDKVREIKQAKAKRICISMKASVKTPTPTIDTPITKSPFAPAKQRRLSHSTPANEIANIEMRIPVSMRPELKMGATSETPRSLRALCVQLNHGERAIEILMETAAQIGAAAPSHADISGSKTFLSLLNI